jgi:hypothetical protein
MKPTTKSTSGSSFHNDTFIASVSDLRKILGAPIYEANTGDDKVNFDWEMETHDGMAFTVYDWKEYRTLSETESIEWHIGGVTKFVTSTAVTEINNALNNI